MNLAFDSTAWHWAESSTVGIAPAAGAPVSVQTHLTPFSTNAVPGLGANIFCILSGLRALSQHSDCRLRVLRVSDVFSHMPCMELVRCILSVLPRLHTLSVSFDLKNQLEGNRPDGNPSCSNAEIPGRKLILSNEWDVARKWELNSALSQWHVIKWLQPPLSDWDGDALSFPVYDVLLWSLSLWQSILLLHANLIQHSFVQGWA